MKLTKKLASLLRRCTRRRPYLRIRVSSGDREIIALNIRKFPASIGRAKQADVQLRDRFVSEIHCLLDYRNGRFVVQDCESLNGTLLNSRPVTTARVCPGDTIDVGATQLTVRAAAIPRDARSPHNPLSRPSAEVPSAEVSDRDESESGLPREFLRRCEDESV